MKGIIYKITNTVNNKSYIGQTRQSIQFRWNQHTSKKDNTYFHNAIQKYGKDNFTIEILEECDVSELNEKEIFYIAKYDTFKNGYNLTIGGDGNKRLLLDDKYDEIKELYLSGFSSNKIATLYKVDKSTIVKILIGLGVKIRKNNLKINNQELQELIQDYKIGHSLRSLAKRYNCSAPALKDFLIRKGVDVKNKYSILEDKESQLNLINDYLDNELTVSEIQSKYHCSYNTLLKILSLNGVQKGKYNFKLKNSECLELIKMYNNGKSIKEICNKFKISRKTIYTILHRYGIKKSDSIIVPRVSTT